MTTSVALAVSVLAVGYVAGRWRPWKRFRYWLRWTRRPGLLWLRLAAQPVTTARAVRILWHRRTDPTWTDRPRREPVPLDVLFGSRRGGPKDGT